jgi:phage terminase Nu1 subunit (DNA packaging protein)
MDINEKLTFNQAEAAELLGVSRRTLIDWAKLKQPVPYRSGGPGKPAEYEGRALIEWFVRYRVWQARHRLYYFSADDF